jgi:hypothetical protein
MFMLSALSARGATGVMFGTGRFAGARPYPMWRALEVLPPVPVAATATATAAAAAAADAVPLVAVVCAGASTPRAAARAPLVDWVRESRLFAAAYHLDLPHVWLYGLDDAGQPPWLPAAAPRAPPPAPPAAAAGDADALWAHEQAVADAEDIPLTEEAADMFAAALAALIALEAGRRVVVVGYSLGAVLTLAVWPRAQEAAAATGAAVAPGAILVGGGISMPADRREVVRDFFTRDGLSVTERYAPARAAHGPLYETVLRCTRRWLAGDPADVRAGRHGHGTVLFCDDDAHRRARATDPHLHLVFGASDWIYTVPDVFGPSLTPPPWWVDLGTATDAAAVEAAVVRVAAAQLPARAHPPAARPLLAQVPGEHFAMVAGEGALATRAVFHLYAAHLAGTVAMPPVYTRPAHL